MDNYYLLLVTILFALAASDLVIGVSNDAVNFLNSAIGSKTSPKWLVFMFAGLGILIGATFSSGMMEVARKGIFNPGMFVFSDIMIIFLAVMITDVTLINTFNTFGLPTSTTVSIVFELLGSSVAVSLIKIYHHGGSVFELSKYINSDKALAIISGILISVIIAFTFGTIIQYISRLVFSFRYEKQLKYFGSVFGGSAITIITYFILIKGIEGSSFADIVVHPGLKLDQWIKTNSFLVLLYGFLGWTAILQVLFWLFKVDILKIIVLIGTFALAMAFAGNDMVNFIGSPLAGFASFNIWKASGHVSPDTLTMGQLRGNIETPWYFFVIAGLIMILALFFSKKARAVIATSVNLGRQAEGSERFGSSLAARILVRNTVQINKKIQKNLPSQFNIFLQKRFANYQTDTTIDPDAPAFDKIRASVTLVVSSALIAFGTSLKLPLSTTYVTFMVAMGASLADRAWDRESAVYRVSGVLVVIGGWFLTAIIAFTISGVVAMLLFAGGRIMVLVMILLALLMVIRTHIIFRNRTRQQKEDEEEISTEKEEAEKVTEKSKKLVLSLIATANKIYSTGIRGFLNEDRMWLHKALELKEEFNRKSRKHKDKVHDMVDRFKKEDIDSGHFYVQVVDFQRKVFHALNFILEPMSEHFENQHKPFINEQVRELISVIEEVDGFYKFSAGLVKDDRFSDLEELVAKRDTILSNLAIIEKAQIKRIRTREVNTRNSILFFNTLTETKNMLLQFINMIKAHRDFIQFTLKK
jgi:phosphate/sulfate permease